MPSDVDGPVDREVVGAQVRTDAARAATGPFAFWRAVPWRPFLFAGRLGRSEYAWSLLLWHLMFGLGAGVLFFVALVVLSFAGDPRVTNVGVSAVGAVAVATYLTGLASYAVRRLQDMDRSGTLVLLGFVPIVNVAFAAALLFAPGTPGPNTYGRRTFTSAVRAAIEIGAADREEKLDEAFDEGRRFAEGRS